MVSAAMRKPTKPSSRVNTESTRKIARSLLGVSDSPFMADLTPLLSSRVPRQQAVHVDHISGNLGFLYWALINDLTSEVRPGREPFRFPDKPGVGETGLNSS